jgi:hypothetical protein
MAPAVARAPTAEARRYAEKVAADAQFGQPARELMARLAPSAGSVASGFSRTFASRMTRSVDKED